MNARPAGMRCETTARQAITPLRLTISTQSLSATSIRAASSGASHTTGPPRNSSSIRRLSWNSEWIDHFECGVRAHDGTSAAPSASSSPVVARRQRAAAGRPAGPRRTRASTRDRGRSAGGRSACATGRRVDVDGERRVAPVRLSIPDHSGEVITLRGWTRCAERDPLVLAVLGEVGQRVPVRFSSAGSPRRRGARWWCPRAGRSSRDVDVALELRAPVGDAAADDAVAAAQLLDLRSGFQEMPFPAMPRSRPAGRAPSSCRATAP